jgi:hypothetical protein
MASRNKLQKELYFSFIMLGIYLFVHSPFSACSPFVWAEIDYFKTSISIYTITGSENFIKKHEDRRGQTWEWQMQGSRHKYNITMVSNGETKIPGYDVIVLTDSGNYSRDRVLCQRTANSLIHFTKYFNDYKWYYRGISDTYIDCNNLFNIIEELELKYDPMKEVAMAYGLHVSRKVGMFPHGGSGYLFSNYAVNLFVENIEFYRKTCVNQADDTTFTLLFERLNIDIEKWHSDRFMQNWPRTDVAKKECPQYYQLYPGALKMIPSLKSRVAVAHMHHIPMPIMRSRFTSVNGSFGLYWETSPTNIFFCTF